MYKVHEYKELKLPKDKRRVIMAVSPLDRLKQRGLLQNTLLGYWARSPIPSSTTNYLYVNYNDKAELSYKGEKEMSNLTENANTYSGDYKVDSMGFSGMLFPRTGCVSIPRLYAVKVNETKMIVEDNGVKFAYNPNMPIAYASDIIIPRIEDVQSINNKVVIVKFADGTTEKAVLSDDDTFSLEQGISICITKKILNKVLKGANGSSAYNKLVDYGLNVYKDKEKNAKKKAEDEKKAKEAEQKRIEKIHKKRAKRKAKLREEQIEIQAEAYRRAMQTD